MDEIIKNASCFLNNLNNHKNLEKIKKFTSAVLIAFSISNIANAGVVEENYNKFNEIISNKEVKINFINESFYDSKKYSDIEKHYDLNLNNYNEIFNNHVGIDKIFVVNNPYTPNLKNVVFFPNVDETQLQQTGFFVANSLKKESLNRDSSSFIEMNNSYNEQFFGPELAKEEKSILNFFILSHELAHATPKQSPFIESDLSINKKFSNVNDYRESDSDINGYLYTSNSLKLNQKEKDFLLDKILHLRISQYSYEDLVSSFYESVKIRSSNLLPNFFIKSFLSDKDQKIYESNISHFNNHSTIKSMLILRHIEKKYSSVIKNLSSSDYLLFSNAVLKVDNKYSDIKFSDDIINSIGIISEKEVSNFFNSEFENIQLNNYKNKNYNAKEQFILNLYSLILTSKEKNEDINLDDLNSIYKAISERSKQIFHDSLTVGQKNSFLMYMIGTKNSMNIQLDENFIDQEFSYAFNEFVALKTIKDKFKNEPLNENTALNIKKEIKHFNLKD